MRLATHFLPLRRVFLGAPRPVLQGDVSRAGRIVLAALLAILVLGASGCVSRSGYDEALRERDIAERQKQALATRIEQLELSTNHLGNEVKDLTGQLEDVEVERDRLQDQLSRLSENHVEVQRNLDETSAELALRAAEVNKLHGTYDALVSDLESEVAAGRIQIQQLREGLQVNVPDQILFDSGSAVLSQVGAGVLTKVAQQLVSLPNPIQVIGHSDDRKIRPSSSSPYPSNWELAGARAAAVVRVFEKTGIVGERLIAISRAEYQPVASNETPEDRALNRRIEILLLPDDSRSQAESSGLQGS